MNGPSLMPARLVAAETFHLGSDMPLPIGNLPVNAYVIRGQQPILVDTGLPALSDAFVAELGKLLDPADLAWVVLTHADLDHIGSLKRILELAPRAKLVTSFLGFGKLSLIDAVSPDRLHLLNPGQRLDAGDRELVVLRPPIFDAPETHAFFDTRTRTLFSSDSFGGLVPAGLGDPASLPAQVLADGMRAWATIDAPWIHDLTAEALLGRMRPVRELAPERVLSSHLPPAAGSLLDALVANVLSARTAAPFVGPTMDDLMRRAG
jgi:glyoxylase-like metal-dependent hydrolase (beta-lactamase superfamily II)